MFSFYKILRFFRIEKVVQWFVRIDPHPHCIFDWYSAPIATHHTYSEAKSWFKEFNLRVIASNETTNPTFYRRMLLKISAPTVTLKGEKQ